MGAPFRVQRGRVGQRLDGAAGLAQGQGGVDIALDRRIEIVRAADHGQDLAGPAVEHHGSGVVDPASGVGGLVADAGRAAVELVEPASDDGFGLVLEVEIEGCGHGQSALAHHVKAELVSQQRLDVHHKVGRLDVEQVGAKAQRFCRQQRFFLVAEVAAFAHQAQHGQLASLGHVRMLQGTVAERILDQPGQNCTFGAAQLGRRFVVEDLGRGLDTVGPVSIIGLVEIERQQLVFRIAKFEAHGQPCLAQLAPDRLLVAFLRLHQQRARQLLG